MSSTPSSSAIRIDRIDTDGTDLECTITCTDDLRRFFGGEPFRVSYDVSIEDVPEGILAIPVLSQVCPVAWATGADVYVPEVDETFAHALGDVEETLLSLYPEFMEGGTLYAGETIDVEPDLESGDGETPSDSGLLFTGGVDSTCSYIRHREEEPTLISIRGWTISPSAAHDDRWDDLQSRVQNFADERDLESQFVESNMLSFLDHPMLLAHFKRFVDGGWYSSVGHGVGLLGLCAPMAHARDMENLYVAATHWDGIDLEWGSRPDIDDHVRWAGTQCHHDAYDLTRQERLDVIADYVHEHSPDLQLQTCNDRMDGNCGRCEKCYRTAVGLRLSGLEPTDHGYPFSETDYHDLRRSLENGEWILGEDERYMWEDIRNRVRETEPESAAEREFFSWLETADLGELVDESKPPLSHRALRAGARNTPHGVYSTLYPAWNAAKNASRRLGL
ncbi:hypothetical protein [Natronoglomus mannanivorans]|uniref:Uncharacterized protein n=1 Tax=Natronoglomus mannanivorans TaxID=2979990 RepID=A0AAP3E2L4_9EURY|nr:hypothetical protein [Halobacteria archaeon AArc-xg1-1]